MFEKAAKTFSFIGHFKLFGVISIILCTIGILGIILTAFGVPALNMDQDFVGGTSMEIELGTTVTQDIQNDVASIYKEATGAAATVTTSGNSGTGVTIKSVEVSTEQRQTAYDKIAEKYGDGVSLLSTDYTSASVGSDLTRAAFISCALAVLFILIYITIRFELRSGLSAIICLIHDVLCMVAFAVILRLPINMNFIAAALTIIGYSINATIVVFDRVRENYKLQGNSGEFSVIVDKSIWQTMRRSIGTTVTTMLPVIMIIILGVTSIRIFAIFLLVGILAGGFSSTCISGNLWNSFKKIGKGAN